MGREVEYFYDSSGIRLLTSAEVRPGNLTLKVKKIIILRYPNL